jgi:hypothetical protein
MLGQVFVLQLAWAAALPLLLWGHMPQRWRRALALLTSVAGVVFLVLALNSEGSRESPSTAVFLLGQPYAVGKVEASASLSYYVLTAACLILGFASLVAGDELARATRTHWIASAIVLSWVVTFVRFVLEKAAAPPLWAQLIGVVWLAPVVGAYFWLSLRPAEGGLRPLIRALLIYAYATRSVVALLMVVASTWRLGTHYDVSGLTRGSFGFWTFEFEEGSAAQILTIAGVAQLLIWPIYTLISGLIGAGLARYLSWVWRGPSLKAPRPQPQVEAPDAR